LTRGGYPVPRDEVWIAPYPYRYSGRIYPAYEVWTDTLLSIKKLVEDKTRVKYDSVLCNRYRDGSDSVALHCDCEPEMSSAHPIASISVGAERRFVMEEKEAKIKEAVTLAHGSLLISGDDLFLNDLQTPKSTALILSCAFWPRCGARYRLVISNFV
jgi:alkylated DNA repair dioxygenase AlkB